MESTSSDIDLCCKKVDHWNTWVHLIWRKTGNVEFHCFGSGAQIIPQLYFRTSVWTANSRLCRRRRRLLLFFVILNEKPPQLGSQGLCGHDAEVQTVPGRTFENCILYSLRLMLHIWKYSYKYWSSCISRGCFYSRHFGAQPRFALILVTDLELI